jgi:hypothetical protein
MSPFLTDYDAASPIATVRLGGALTILTPTKPRTQSLILK